MPNDNAVKTYNEEYATRMGRMKPPTPAEPPTAPVEPQIVMADLDTEMRADIQKRSDEAAARQRLDQYVDEQGLESTDHNFKIIESWIMANVKAEWSAGGVAKNLQGYWSQNAVDAAIQATAGQLTWKPKVMAPPAPPEQEKLLILADGSQQLPLDSPSLKGATKDQAKDWLKRYDASRRLNQRGWFGSKF
jgi:hypothetical protein